MAVPHRFICFRNAISFTLIGTCHSLIDMYATLHVAEGLFCPQSSRIDWIPSGGINVGEPWASYTNPNRKCCDVTNPGTAFSAQGKHTHVHTLFWCEWCPASKAPFTYGPLQASQAWHRAWLGAWPRYAPVYTIGARHRANSIINMVALNLRQVVRVLIVFRQFRRCHRASLQQLRK